MEQVIIDGDWGGDEMQLAAVLLANPQKVNVLGATCTFGNTGLVQVVENARNILHLFKQPQVKVYAGAAHPSDAVPSAGDGAHGSDGIGNVNLPVSPLPYESTSAVDFILQQLREKPAGTITITASGPLTNLAEAIRREPETMQKVKRLVIMGGCTHPIPAHDVAQRQGNITHYGEFNFQQAAADAQTVMQSGLPIVLLPMNCTQQLAFTPARQQALSDAFITRPVIKNQLVGMMAAPAEFDRRKFDSPPFMHDVHCGLYLVMPEAYQLEKGRVQVHPKDGVEGAESRTGFSQWQPDENSNLAAAVSVKNPDALFAEFLNSITMLLPPQKQLGMSSGK